MEHQNSINNTTMSKWVRFVELAENNSGLVDGKYNPTINDISEALYWDLKDSKDASISQIYKDKVLEVQSNDSIDQYSKYLLLTRLNKSLAINIPINATVDSLFNTFMDNIDLAIKDLKQPPLGLKEKKIKVITPQHVHNAPAMTVTAALHSQTGTPNHVGSLRSKFLSPNPTDKRLTKTWDPEKDLEGISGNVAAKRHRFMQLLENNKQNKICALINKKRNEQISQFKLLQVDQKLTEQQIDHLDKEATVPLEKVVEQVKKDFSNHVKNFDEMTDMEREAFLIAKDVNGYMKNLPKGMDADRFLALDWIYRMTIEGQKVFIELKKSSVDYFNINSDKNAYASWMKQRSLIAEYFNYMPYFSTHLSDILSIPALRDAYKEVKLLALESEKWTVIAALAEKAPGLILYGKELTIDWSPESKIGKDFVEKDDRTEINRVYHFIEKAYGIELGVRIASKAELEPWVNNALKKK